MKKTIFVVDDHLLVAKALKVIINSFSGFTVIDIAENGKILTEKLEKITEKPDIILLDVSVPIMDGFETAQFLNKKHPEIKVLALSIQEDDKSVLKMIKYGAKGYMLKDTHPKDLENALVCLSNNGFYYPEWASKIIFSTNDDEEKEDKELKISDREKEFLYYTVTELSYKEIAEKMYCSPRTVESYRDQLCDKLGLKTRVGLAIFALKNGFAEL
ncbi:response regulator transcription factor [Chryseobacterium sp. RR2-3-20]|uniref:response regulator transcription factor n=1 Tax=Chryseobacterium sp. RR2-3-20 TaxID=2787626 RepID=UPI001AE053B6|nr:response regulator transcription factor [Chryseobacterium sp. RR2-3-20]